MKILVFILPFVLLLFAGCDKPGPVSLVDPTNPTKGIEIDTTSAEMKLNSSSPEIDSSGYFVSTGGPMFGQIIIAGARYDAANEHHDASLAQVLFFDSGKPIVVRGDTIGFHSLNIGNARVNDLLLTNVLKHIIVPLLPITDSIIGYQYFLYNKDGVGGRGFEYSGNTLYHWKVTGSTGFTAYDDTLRTPPVITVVSPAPGDEIDPTKNLHIQFSGNVGSINIFIRHRPLFASQIESNPILKLKANVQGNGIIIPSTVLRLLPRLPDAFLFSFQVTNSRIIHIPGYPNGVLLSGSYVHHLVLRIKR